MRPSFLLVVAGASLAACRPCKPRTSSSTNTPLETLVETPVASSTATLVAPVVSSVATSVPRNATQTVFTLTRAQTSALDTAVSSASLDATPVVSTQVSAGTSTAAAVASSVVSSASLDASLAVSTLPAIETSTSATTATPVASSAASSQTSSAAPSKATNGSSSGFLFTGINEAGAEFGTGNIPGTEGTDYTFPNTSAIDILFDAGMNAFRVGFLMERMVPDELTGTLDSDYFDGINTVVTHITGKGAYAILDPHNYGRYYSNIITDVDAFGSFWTTLATKFADNELVVFDTNNEYHDMENSLVAELNQAAITAIRGAGATSQYIFVEGNSYSGAWTWVSSGNGDSLVDLTDPQDKLIYEMHQYLDSDGSGTAEACVDSTIGATRLEAATAWLKENGKLGIIGETAGANNEVCQTAIKGELQHLQDNSDVWVGFLWWAAGPWWDDYMFSMEPSNGIAYENYLSIIQEFLV